MGKYRTLGTFFDRIFRNDLNANFNDIDADVQAQKKRVDDLIVGVEQPSEVVDARGGFTVLRDRLADTDAQLAENVPLVQNITRDLQITGVQTLVFDKPVKGVMIFGAVNGTDMMTIGFTNKSGNKGVLAKINEFYKFDTFSIIFQAPGSPNYTSGVVAISENTVNINWAHVLSGTTGTAQITVVAFV